MHQSTATETNKPQSQRHLQEADQALCDQQAGLSFGDENTESIRGSGAVRPRAAAEGFRGPGLCLVALFLLSKKRILPCTCNVGAFLYVCSSQYKLI